MDPFDMDDAGHAHMDAMDVGDIDTSFNEDGEFVIKTPNLQGGHDTFTNGVHTTHTEDNVMGGTDIFHGEKLSERAIPGVGDTTDIYDGDMQPEGTIFPDGIGGEDFVSFDGNTDDIMSLADPLSQAGDVKLPPFDVTNP